MRINYGFRYKNDFARFAIGFKAKPYPSKKPKYRPALLGKIPVTICLEGRAYRDDIHVFPGVLGALISWKAAKELGIMTPRYPHPVHPKQHPEVNRTDATGLQASTRDQLIEEFPTVFNGQIAAMEGELFKISLMDNT